MPFESLCEFFLIIYHYTAYFEEQYQAHLNESEQKLKSDLENATQLLAKRQLQMKDNKGFSSLVDFEDPTSVKIKAKIYFLKKQLSNLNGMRTGAEERARTMNKPPPSTVLGKVGNFFGFNGGKSKKRRRSGLRKRQKKTRK